MSGLVLNLIAKKALKDVKAKSTNSKDPYFEEVAVYDRNGRPTGKTKKQKRPVPQGLSANDAQVLKQVRKRAYRLDMCLFSFFGIRFGWGSVIGLLPVIGDFLDALFAFNVVRHCGHIDGGLPHLIRSQMIFNILLDFGIGLVPVVGDLVDAAYKANTRNTWILQEYLVKKADEEAKLKSKPTRTGQIIDKTSPVRDDSLPDQPQPARTASTGRGWFGRGRSKVTDEEAQETGVTSPRR